jgi:hypothetical protein
VWPQVVNSGRRGRKHSLFKPPLNDVNISGVFSASQALILHYSIQTPVLLGSIHDNAL